MKLDSSIAAIVTGGASGLGEATVRALSACGVRVTIFDLDEKRGPAIAAELGCHFAAVDIGSDESVEAGLASAQAAHGVARILVNCAGIGKPGKTASRSKSDGTINHYPLDAFARILNINVVGTFRCIAKAAAAMLTLDPLEDGERGVVVNTASVAAQDGQMGQAAYAASKAAIVGMALPIARDLSSEGIRINTILPGIFDTPPMAALPDAVREGLGKSVPFPQRLGRPDEFASLVLTFCRNAYLNAESTRLDGAIRMQPR